MKTRIISPDDTTQEQFYSQKTANGNVIQKEDDHLIFLYDVHNNLSFKHNYGRQVNTTFLEMEGEGHFTIPLISVTTNHELQLPLYDTISDSRRIKKYIPLLEYFHTEGADSLERIVKYNQQKL